jgi:hypothetical protein
MSPFSSLTQCQSACTSWSCQYEGNYYEYPDGTPIYPVPNGCLQFANTGSSTSQLTYDACTAQTVCERYDCTDTGCVVGDHVTGMYDSYNDCTGGTATLQACQSMSCGASGSYVYNSPGNPAGLVIPPGYGTGGTWTGADMLLSASTYCKAYNCTNLGCTEQTGWNGMYYDPNDPSNAAAMCQAACISYVCLDEVPDGVGVTSPCVIYNSTPGTPGYVNGFSGSGGTFDSMYSVVLIVFLGIVLMTDVFHNLVQVVPLQPKRHVPEVVNLLHVLQQVVQVITTHYTRTHLVILTVSTVLVVHTHSQQLVPQVVYHIIVQKLVVL